MGNSQRRAHRRKTSTLREGKFSHSQQIVAGTARTSALVKENRRKAKLTNANEERGANKSKTKKKKTRIKKERATIA